EEAGRSLSADMSFLEEDLSCPVCFDTFQQPVVLPCSHSFCRDCLANSWRTSSRPECPNCRKAYPLGFTPPANLVLRNIAEAYLKKQQEDQASVSQGERDARACCSVHGERLLLFCKVDREALCTVCQTSRKHLGHQLCPLDEAIQDLKVGVTLLTSYQLTATLTPASPISKWQTQSSQTELQIKAEFEALRNFLLTEERCRIAALKDETERKGRAMKEKVEDLTAQIALLCNSIALAEREAEAHDLTKLYQTDWWGSRLMFEWCNIIQQGVEGWLPIHICVTVTSEEPPNHLVCYPETASTVHWGNVSSPPTRRYKQPETQTQLAKHSVTPSLRTALERLRAISAEHTIFTLWFHIKHRFPNSRFHTRRPLAGRSSDETSCYDL
uniref:Uncharacterized protein n=1 Tax=Paramormyrops kingsleyae TaxID=1676925 RepID=A0A3B3RH39_9TELE